MPKGIMPDMDVSKYLSGDSMAKFQKGFKGFIAADGIGKILGGMAAARQCLKGADYKCGQQIMASVRNFDPTGIASMLKSFIYPNCEMDDVRANK